jgi:2,3-bisphosphoglycerate-dependent phosphoglycerate mutase
MAYLVLVRHAKSQWNALGLWTGRTDVALSDEGAREAGKLALALNDIRFDRAYSSELKRAKQTLDIVLRKLGVPRIPKTAHKALNERHYGIYTGKNKWEVQKEAGRAAFEKIRRSWDHPIPDGETLKNVHDRIVPYYKAHILADLRKGKNVIVVAHGNSLRALVKHLEKLSAKEVAALEIGVGEAHLYQMNEKGTIVSKEIRAKNPSRGTI